jgi:RNA polymerase sigma-70 factor (ECF subfamily)
MSATAAQRLAAPPAAGGSSPAAVDERLLVRRAQAGDTAAFEALYRRHVGRVHALCRRLVGDPGWAEELVQDVFVLVWSRLPGFRGDSELGTWLHRLAINAVLSARRARSRHDRHLVTFAELVADDLADQDTGAGEPWAGHLPATAGGNRAPAVTVDLERAIAALPPGARAVFVLADVEGHGHAEIAALLNIAAGTSKAQLHRARLLLRKALAS